MNIQMSDITIKVEKTTKTSYYYPSQRQDSCWGKGPFKQRFPKLIESDKVCFCAKFCAFFCFFLSYDGSNTPKNEEQLERLLPIKSPIFSCSPDLITYTWIGHSTAVISIGTHANIIIDPVFSFRCSPVQFAGPKRYRQTACTIQKLPTIHAVLVSHDHFDHLDEQSLLELEEAYHPLFVAGLDSAQTLPEGCKFQQLDWTQTITKQINGHPFQITFVPVCHWSKRKIYQKNTRLWGGFVIKTPKGQKIFYSGDTAYCEIFQQIGQRFGPFDLCILPIGAYQPRHLLSFSHTNPEQSVIIHKQLKSKKSVGVHWGTFPLGFEPYYQPKLDLEAAVAKHGLDPKQFITIGHGDQFSVDYS